MPKCKDCHREIIWAKTVKGKNMPLDPSPHKDGNAMLHADETCTIVAPARKDEIPLEDRYKTHWETCPAKAKKPEETSKAAPSSPEMSPQLRLAPPVTEPSQLPLPSPIRPLTFTKEILGRNESAAVDLARLQLEMIASACMQAAELLKHIPDATPEDGHQILLRVLLMLQGFEKGVTDIHTVINIARDCAAAATAVSQHTPPGTAN